MINAAPKSSLAPTTALASGQSAPVVVASDGTNVYWAATTTRSRTGQSVLGCNLASCTPRTLGSGYTNVKTIVIDVTAIYWTDNRAPKTTNGAIWKLAR